MKPTTLSEKIMFNTVRLECLNGDSGTGFLFNFSFGEKMVPVLITNKHVIHNNQNETMRFLLHLDNGDGSTTENFLVTFTNPWFFHPTQDLCFTFVNPLFNLVKEKSGKAVFALPITENLIYSQEQLETLSMLERVVMVGYPIGLFDAKHNFPIFRQGFTAAHPAYDFNNAGIGLVDMACFPGSSGSPVFILDEGTVSDPKKNIVSLGSRIIFLGVLSSGPVFKASGLVENENIPMQLVQRSVVDEMTNLGYYIKSFELLEFKKIIEPYIANEIK